MANQVASMVFGAVARHAHAAALRCEDGRELSFGQAGERLARLANALRSVSTETGRPVAVLMRNRVEYAEADLAAAVAGKVRAPVNPRLADDERAYALAHIAAETLVTEAAELDRVTPLLRDLPDLRRVLVVDAGASTPLPARALAYEAALGAASPVPPRVAVDDRAPSVVRYTSGTTGRPKGAVISVRARVAAMLHSLVEEHLPGRDDCFLHASPMGHASGDKVLTFFARGACNAFLSKFERERFSDDVARLRATSTFLVPTMLRMLLDAGAGRLGLRNVTYGGSPIDPETRAEAVERFGPVLTQIYGATETPHPVLVLGHDEHLLPETREATGRPAAAVQVRVVDDEGHDVGPGEAGELWVRGANVMSGYWGDPEATAEVLVDGWYRSGDVARVLDGGWYAVVDRRKDLVISGGLNVYPAEVEAALLRHPGVAEAAVLGLPDRVWGEVVAAVVVAAPGAAPTREELVAHCERLLADYKKPRRIEFRDALPKGATNKILKRALRTHPHLPT
jgi:acyl-CoA synthetase (AMP-forming)/AMP-acid ligase II